MSGDRRNFIRTTLGGAAALAVTAARPLGAMSARADEPWLAAYTGKKHKAFMDVMHFFPDGSPFRRAKTLLTVMHDSYGSSDAEIGLLVGMHGAGLAHLMSAAAWDEIGLADWLVPQLNGAELATLKAGAAGSFSKSSGENIRELRARGVHVLACRETIARWAQRVSTLNGETVAAAGERIVRGLHDGVEPVPAMIAATVLSQEGGAHYIAIA
jgi:intracellular sulfur oxidation DsrE/DsrF family protein